MSLLERVYAKRIEEKQQSTPLDQQVEQCSGAKLSLSEMAVISYLSITTSGFLSALRGLGHEL